MSKQVTQIRMGAFIYNGAPPNMTDFRAFQTYPRTYKVWNADTDYSSDFLGGAVQSTLSGYQRGNPMGHRLSCRINLNNASNADSELIRNLLNLTASRFDRGFWTLAGVSASATTITFTNTGLPTNYFRGLTARDGTGNQERLIISSTATSVELASAVSTWQNSGTLIIAKPSHPTIIGVSTDNNDANMNFYNIANNQLGIRRELTIGNQIIQLSLTGVFSEPTIKENIIL
jgi:hypothetical protein